MGTSTQRAAGPTLATDNPRVSVRRGIPVTYGSSFLAFDRGEEIWLLVTTRRPTEGHSQEADMPTIGEHWIVLPRSGAVLALLAAVDVVVPRHHNERDGPAVSLS